MDKSDRNFFSSLLLITGGFILAETIIRNFLSLAEGALPIWILPLIGVLLLVMANDLLHKPRKGIQWAYFLYLLIMVVFIVLLNNLIISGKLFLWFALGLPILYFIIWVWKKINKKFGKKNIK